MSNAPTPPILLLTPKQAAAALSISPRKLWSMTANGEIPYLKIGRLTRYSIDDMQTYIIDHKQGGE